MVGAQNLTNCSREPRTYPHPPTPLSYTAFVIELRTTGGLQWVVERRFSEFYQLNQVRALLLPAEHTRALHMGEMRTVPHLPPAPPHTGSARPL